MRDASFLLVGMPKKLKSLAVAWLIGSIVFFNFYCLSYLEASTHEEAAKMALVWFAVPLLLYFDGRLSTFFVGHYSAIKGFAIGILLLLMFCIVWGIWMSFVWASLVRSFCFFYFFCFVYRVYTCCKTTIGHEFMTSYGA